MGTEKLIELIKRYSVAFEAMGKLETAQFYLNLAEKNKKVSEDKLKETDLYCADAEKHFYSENYIESKRFSEKVLEIIK